MYSSIRALASYVPKKVVTNDDLSKIVETTDEWIVSRTGISKRHISEGENTSDLCTAVFKKLMEESGTDPLDISIIIVATTTPDYLTPTTSCLVQSRTGAKNAFCFDIGAGCSGFVYALSVADKYIKCGYDNVVVIGSETLSKIVDWTDRSTCVLFADGASGVLLSASERQGIIAEDIHTNGDGVFSIVGNQLPVNNAFAPENPVERQYVAMDGRAVFDFAIKEIPKSINALLKKAELSSDDIEWIIPHQANYRIVEAISKKMKIGMNKFYTNMDRYGNTSAASIGIALDEMHKEGKLAFGSGKKIIISGFGSGLTWGSVLIQL